MRAAFTDIVFAIRLLKKSRPFAVAAILTIALGVGVNTAVFSVVNAAILRPLPVPDSHQLVVIASHRPADATLSGVSSPDLDPYSDLLDGAFDGIAGYAVGFRTLSRPGGQAAWVVTTYVTGHYFSTLGISPTVGRLIRSDQVRAGVRSPIAVLGHTAWQRRFGGDLDIVGQQVVVDGRALTIVGVAPRGFNGTQSFADSEVYLPLTWNEPWTALETQHAVGRLRQDASVESGQSALDVVASRLANDEPDKYDGVKFTVVPERLARPLEDLARWNGIAGTMTLALSALVLAIATMNVMNLVLARGADRRRELAVRAALGAGRGRLVRQLLTEAGLVAVIGGVVGVCLGTLAAYALTFVELPGNKPARLDFSLDDRVLGYGMAFTVVTAFFVGLLPALDASRTALADALRDGGERAIGGPRRGWLRRASMVAQIVACFLLLMAAGLFTRSLAGMERVHVGFDPRNILNVGISAEQVDYDEPRGIDLFRRIEDRVRDVPGVESISFASTVPLGYVRLGGTVDIEGLATSPGDRRVAGINVVSASYFGNLGLPIVAGRGFSDTDDRERAPVAVVNRAFSDEFWPGADPIGRRFRFSNAGPAWVQVVGITPTAKYHSIAEDALPFVYLPLAQDYQPFRFLHVRAGSTVDSLRPEVLRAIRQVEPGIAPIDVMTMEQSLGGGFGLFLPRLIARFAGFLALLAVALAVVGLYGLVAYSAGRRMREIGLRMALGATPADVLRLVMSDGVRLVVVGLTAGVIAAYFAVRLFAGFLVGVSARDPLTFTSVAVLLAGVSLVACAIPAVRAIRIEPVDALREE